MPLSPCGSDGSRSVHIGAIIAGGPSGAGIGYQEYQGFVSPVPIDIQPFEERVTRSNQVQKNLYGNGSPTSWIASSSWIGRGICPGIQSSIAPMTASY